ncbi:MULTISPECIES: type III secretion system outer membrane ring subunit SctC [unclassified Sphingomonas]|uniref:type III secretion system outer membrane ring subunit SctC n=1 Tax=unclassified Sphingomonas TaxID=196159 RepID=UPI000829553E|nr:MULTISPECIES: type III secretion system outer membrane ring subunit SctC [unclassified Sphingomonas]
MTVRRLMTTILATAGLALSAVPAAAGDPPFADRRVALNARNDEVAAFIRRFFSSAGLTVSVDPAVKGRINGRFEGAAATVWSQIARSFNLVAYHDGSTVIVYPAGQVQSRTIPVVSRRGGELVSAVNQSGLSDSINQVRAVSEDAVLATGVPKFLDQVAQLASALPTRPDIPQTAQISPARGRGYQRVEPYELRVFYLRYARADDTTLMAGGRELIVPGVGSTLSRIMGDGAPVAGSVYASYGGRSVRQSQPRLGGRGLNAVPPGPAQTPQIAPYEDELLGLPPGPAVAAESGPGYAQRGPRIAIDPSINAVVVRDRPENMPAYEGLVRALDVRPMIVELEATIIDLNIDRLRELGINWRIQSEGFSSLFGGDIVRRTGDPAVDFTRLGQVNRGLSLSGVIGSNREFIGRLSALEEKGAARVVSRPQIVTLSNVEAVFDRTRTFYVRVAGDRQVDLFNVTAGTVLRVNPHVLYDNGRTRIRMVVGVEDGAVLDAEVDDIPIVDRASVNTQAMINEGEGLLLGGLTVNADFDAETKIPLLGDIPVLGELFKSRSKRRQKTERLFLITPRIIPIDTVAVQPAAATPPVPIAPAPVKPKRQRKRR